jgi:hypothetical protein
MTREEKISQLNDIFAEINEDDNAVCYLTSEDNELIESAIEALSQESCYNPDEWCHDCSEYNQDKHCCPRFNKVIRNAVKEMKEPKMGHWIDDEFGSKCSWCGIHTHLDKFDKPMKLKHCSMCGARMIESQESEKTDERG